MVGWHHQLNGHDFEQTPGVGDGQGGLMCYSPWDSKESDMSERLNWIWMPEAKDVKHSIMRETGALYKKITAKY